MIRRRISSRSMLWLYTLLLGCGGGASLPAQQEPSAAAAAPHLQVLGIVQDGGLPHAGCSCDRCQAGRLDPKRRRHVASLALVLTDRQETYLFDATPDLREQLAMLGGSRPETAGRVDRQPLTGVFLTHAHIGHYLGLAFFGYEAIHTSRLPVFASPRMAEFLSANGPWSQLVDLENIVLQPLTAGEPVALEEGVAVTPIFAPHRDEYADTLGFLIEGPNRRVFYLPDTDSWIAWPTPVTDLLAAVDVALLDGTFFSTDELPGRRVEQIGHPLIEATMDLLQALVDAHRLEVFFTHLNHSNPALDPDSDARRRVESRGFAILAEGQKIPL